MKKLIATILTLTALSVGASEITRIDFMQMVEDRDSSLNSVMEPAMFIQRSGQTLERRTVSYRKKYGVDEKSLVRFEKPADVRYTMYLTWSYEDLEREDDMWLYHPDESLIRRISGGRTKEAFMRSGK
jgi:hypothetical protein